MNEHISNLSEGCDWRKEEIANSVATIRYEKANKGEKKIKLDLPHYFRTAISINCFSFT